MAAPLRGTYPYRSSLGMPSLGVLRELDPFRRKLEPALLIGLADRLRRHMVAFLGFATEALCISLAQR